MGVQIFVNRKAFEFQNPTVTGAQLLTTAGFKGSSYDLFQLQGEGDPSGGALVLATQELTLKDGEHFRVIPGNRTFGG